MDKSVEEATVGKMLALGDVKAVWVQSIGAASMEKHSDHEWMLEHRADGSEFNTYRALLWRALRRQPLMGS